MQQTTIEVLQFADSIHLKSLSYSLIKKQGIWRNNIDLVILYRKDV